MCEDDHQVLEKTSSLAEVELLHLQFGLLDLLPVRGARLLQVVPELGCDVIHLWPLRILRVGHRAETRRSPRVHSLPSKCGLLGVQRSLL